MCIVLYTCQPVNALQEYNLFPARCSSVRLSAERSSLALFKSNHNCFGRKYNVVKEMMHLSQQLWSNWIHRSLATILSLSGPSLDSATQHELKIYYTAIYFPIELNNQMKNGVWIIDQAKVNNVYDSTKLRLSFPKKVDGHLEYLIEYWKNPVLFFQQMYISHD